MILVGDKIKLVKEIPDGFNKIGQIFRISHIDNGHITFYLDDTIAGCMSYDEFEKYFEKVEKREWSDWSIRKGESAYDPFTGGVYPISSLSFRTNGKKVQVRYCGYKAEATCCSGDKFNIDTGFKLAKCRLIAKMIAGQVDAYAKSL